MKKKLSYFHWDLLRLTITISAFIYSFYADWLSELLDTGHINYIYLIRIVLGVFVWFAFILFHSNLDETLNIRYKIVEKDEGWGCEYYAKVFRIWFIIIPYWTPVKETYHSYKAENMFGAKMDMGYSNECTFKSEKKARKAIDEYKKTASDNVKRYFEREVIKVNKIKY